MTFLLGEVSTYFEGCSEDYMYFSFLLSLLTFVRDRTPDPFYECWAKPT